jgi:hypothetical protein
MRGKINNAIDALNRDLFEKLRNVNHNFAYEQMIREQQRFERLRELTESPVTRVVLQGCHQFELNKSIELYQKSIASLKTLSESYYGHLDKISYKAMSQYDANQFIANIINTNQFLHAGCNFSASIVAASKALEANIALIDRAIISVGYLKPLALRPSFELHSFLLRSEKLSERKTKYPIELAAIKTSIELASNKSIESTNLIISTSNSLAIQEDEELGISEILPTFNFYDFQRKEILSLVRNNPDAMEDAEAIINLPSWNYYKATKRFCYLLPECNQKCGATGRDNIFKPTNKLMLSLIALPDLIAYNKLTFGEFIDYLYISLYEGSGGDNLRIKTYLSDEELQPLWDIKQLRNFYLRHDIEHGDMKQAKQKTQKVGEIFQRLIGRPIPENSTDFKKAQFIIMNNVLTMIILLYSKINDNNCS